MASHAQRKALDALATDLRSAGKSLTYETLSVRGFPNRFDMTVHHPVYIDPVLNLRWQAEFVQLLSLSYQSNKMIIAWPPIQQIQINDQPFDILTEKMRTSLSFDSISDLQLDTAITESAELTLSNAPAWQIHFGDLLVALRRSFETGQRVEFAISARHLPKNFAAQPESWLESLMADLALVEFSVAIDFDGPVPANPCAADSAAIKRIVVQDSQLRWQDGMLALNGDLALTNDKLSGFITLETDETGFSALAAKIPKTPAPLPFSRDEIALAALALDFVMSGPATLQFEDGWIVYQDRFLIPLPPLQLCPEG